MRSSSKNNPPRRRRAELLKSQVRRLGDAARALTAEIDRFEAQLSTVEELEEEPTEVQSLHVQSSEPPPSQVLRLRDVTKRVGLSSTTIYRLRMKGRFPEPIQLSTTAVGWVGADIAAWIAANRRQRPEGR